MMNSSAPEARAHVAFADALANGFRGAGDDRIAGNVPMKVVDHLQIVDIDEQRRVFPGMSGQGLVDGGHGATAIEKCRSNCARIEVS